MTFVVYNDSLFGPFHPFQPIPINRYLVRSNSQFVLIVYLDSEWRVFISYEGIRSYILVPGSLSLNPGALSVSATTPIGGSSIDIYAVVWGCQSDHQSSCHLQFV
jgi:hypothetical protein